MWSYFSYSEWCSGWDFRTRVRDLCSYVFILKCPCWPLWASYRPVERGTCCVVVGRKVFLWTVPFVRLYRLRSVTEVGVVVLVLAPDVGVVVLVLAPEMRVVVLRSGVALFFKDSCRYYFWFRDSDSWNARAVILVWERFHGGSQIETIRTYF